MDKIVLPEPDYYTASMLAERWGCGLYDVLHYGQTGQLKMYVVSQGWYLDEGSYDLDGEDSFRIPEEERWSRNELLEVFPSTVGDLIKFQKVESPSFVCQKGRYSEIATGLHDNHSHKVVEIFIGDLVVPISEKISFEGKSIKQNLVSQDSHYKTPYIDLMFRAIDENGISEKNQGKVDNLTLWFMEQKIDGKNITKTLAQKMATFIRLPESQKGGNKPFKKG